MLEDVTSAVATEDGGIDLKLKVSRIHGSESPEARFRRLYDLHYESLLAYALRRCQDENEAHDVTAETFLVLWRRLGQAPPDSEVPLWLYGVAKRVLSNRQRTTFRAQRVVARLGQLTPEDTDTEELVAQRGEARAVMSSLVLLRDDEREILLLAAWERLPTSEIAAAIGCTPNAAAIRLHRARRRLSEIYAKENDRTGDEDRVRPELPPTAEQDR